MYELARSYELARRYELARSYELARRYELARNTKKPQINQSTTRLLHFPYLGVEDSDATLRCDCICG